MLTYCSQFYLLLLPPIVSTARMTIVSTGVYLAIYTLAAGVWHGDCTSHGDTKW